ncbi:MAG: solute:sodium symporter family transporter [Pseudomonadota bacterium]
MTTQETLLTGGSCFAFMVLVAWFAFRREQRTAAQASVADRYFLAGRSLSGVFIAGSLLLTNLSAEQLIGLNGSAYAFNLSSMAWEVTAAVAIVVMALVFLPRYLARGFTTLPEYLEQRFDSTTRRLSALLFLVGYSLITIPAVLYAGAVAVLQLFDVSAQLNIDRTTALTGIIAAIAGVGAAYAVFGGLRAIAISDTLNGVGLLVFGALIPYLGLSLLGNGSWLDGCLTLLRAHQEKLNAIGASDDPTPFGTLFTGMILANLFYWGTNQYVIQRTLGAASLAEGQKGVLLSGYFKLLVPLFMMMPGVIAFHLYGTTLASMDDAYPRLVADVLPGALSGLFLAVLLGAVFSSFNSLVNSAATLLTLDLLEPLRSSPFTDQRRVRVAQIASAIIALASVVMAPLLDRAPDGLWQVIRTFTGFYNIPIIAIVLAGLFAPRVPAAAAKTVLLFHVLSYGILRFVWSPDLNFVHQYALLFLAECLIMVSFARHTPRVPPAQIACASPAALDLTPWRHTPLTAGILLAAVVGLYIVFSPLGIAR